MENRTGSQSAEEEAVNDWARRWRLEVRGVEQRRLEMICQEYWELVRKMQVTERQLAGGRER